MSDQKLTALATRLDVLQAEAIDLLQTEANAAPASLDKLQLRDMVAVVEQDAGCRITLEGISTLMPRIEIPEDNYRELMKASAKVLSALRRLQLPDSMQEAFDIVDTAVHSPARHSLADIFTMISILVTATALCLTQLDPESQHSVVGHLDLLLDMKQQQLSLIQQFAQWNGRFTS